MKKIKFNDKYLLTQAVLDGKKTMTRGIAYDFRNHAGAKVGKCFLDDNGHITNTHILTARKENGRIS